MATINSAATGVWSATSTWSGGVVPVVGDKVNILSGHVVTVNGTFTAGDDTSTAINVQAGGTLNASRAVSSQLTVRGELVVADNGTLNYGTLADPIPSGVTATIILNDSATLAMAKWGATFANGSIMHMNGATKKTNTTMSSAAAAATSIVVADATGWAVGDKIVLFPTQRETATATQAEEVTIAGTYVGGTTIPLTTGLLYPHAANCPVSNVAKNVKVTSISTTYRGYFTMIYGNLNALGEKSLSNVCFWDVGDASNAATGKWSATITGSGLGATSNQNIWSHIRESVWYHQASTTGSRCPFTSHVATQRLNMEDCAFICTGSSSVNALYQASGTVIDYRRCNILSGSVGISTGYSEGGKNCRHFDCNFACGSGNAIISGTGMATEFYDCKLMGRGYLFYPNNLPSCLFDGCDIGYTFPLYSHNTNNTVTGGSGFNSLGDITLNECIIGSNLYAVDRTSIDDALESLRIYYKSKNADPLQQEQYQKTGEIVRDNTTFYRSQSSLRLSPYISGRAHEYSFQFLAKNATPLKVTGYLRFNTAYGTATPPSVSISGLGITPVSFTAPATAETWHKFELDVTQSSGADGNLTFTVSGTSSNTTAAYFYLDGIVSAPYVTACRHYGYKFQETSATREVDPVITVSTEATVGAYTGIAIDHDLQTITLTEDHSVSELYDYVYYDICQTDSLTVPEYFTSTDGINFTCTYDITLNGGNLTGSGAINMPTNTFTLTSGTTTLTVTNSTGTTGLLTVSGLSTHSVLLVDGTGAQLDYQASVTGTYSYFIPSGSTGTWKALFKKAGYAHQVITFDASTGGAYSYSANTPQKLAPDGSAMYQGTTSAYCAVSFTGTTQANIDIANGTATLQAVLDESEVALATNAGMLWLASGKSDLSIFNSGGGDYLFMTDNWRLRRASSGDVNATVQAFVTSTQGIIVDGTNGGVQFLTSDSAEAIAQAVWAAADRTLTTTIPTASQNAAQVRAEIAPELLAIDEIHTKEGLKEGSPVTVTKTSISTGGIFLTLSGDGENTTVVARNA